jgi:formamidopyrimidine-DNA glycosylase
MPELPEVETIARGLAKRVTGDRIESVWLGAKKEPLKSSPREIVAVLEQSSILGVRRAGKHIVFDLTRETEGESKHPSQWIIHLGMTGRVLVCDVAEPLVAHTHAVVKLVSGREIRFVDPRRFGRLSVSGNGEFAAPGVEPLQVPLDRFIALFRGRKAPIKSALLNQTLLSGVGNIYADESLHRAGIRPRRRAAWLTHEDLGRLRVALRKVLGEAIKQGGSSISDYVGAGGEEGFFQLRHRVYGREGEPCRACKTSIKRILIAGRSSHYCPVCQR